MIDEELAAHIYKLVGGRMIHLKFIAKTSHLKVCVQHPMQRTGLVSHHKNGAIIAHELLKKGSISDDTYYSLVNVDTGDKLLETNVFAIHVNSREITFQSAVMKRFCEINSALWEGK
jgi:hypothetical protein